MYSGVPGRLRRVGPGVRLAGGDLEDLGDPEVEELDVVWRGRVAQENVVGLDVAVEDPLVVRVRQCGADLDA
jgi:hypothetical protein